MSKLLVIFSEYLISKKIFIVDEEKLEVYKENLLPKQSLSATERAAIPSAAAQTAAEATAEAKAEAKAVRAHSATERAAIPSAAQTAAEKATAAEAKAVRAPSAIRDPSNDMRDTTIRNAEVHSEASLWSEEYDANKMLRGNSNPTQRLNMTRIAPIVAQPFSSHNPYSLNYNERLQTYANRKGGAPTKSQLTGDDIMEVFMKMLQILDENKNNS